MKKWITLVKKKKIKRLICFFTDMNGLCEARKTKRTKFGTNVKLKDMENAFAHLFY
jgi:glutamine synthetase